MRHKHLYGNVAFNNGLVLEDGRVSIAYPGDDEDGTPALRLHDGTTPGGWEAVSEGRGVNTGPGSEVLQAGDYQAGFYGEVPTADFIDGDALASEIGLTAGNAQNTDSPWLKFSYQNRTLFVAKKTYRHSISWDDINGVGAVNGASVITLHGKTYKVRLLTGDGYPYGEAPGECEWNSLLYPIVKRDPNGQGWNINYTNEDLSIGTSSGDGYRNWCQERDRDDNTRAINRGQYGVVSFFSISTDYIHDNAGWRPCLELVE